MKNTVNNPIHFTKQSNPIIQTRHEVCVYGREGGQITVTVFYCETCCLIVSECRQTSVCNSLHSWHWQNSPLQSAFSLQAGFHSPLLLKTRPPSPVQYTQTNTVSASTSQASERGITSQCNELQPVHQPQALATDDTIGAQKETRRFVCCYTQCKLVTFGHPFRSVPHQL